jgi:ATP-dependent RNA helicase DDX5/DBP2
MSYGSSSYSSGRGDNRYDDRSSYRGGGSTSYGSGTYGGGGGGGGYGGSGGHGGGFGNGGDIGAGLRSINWDLSKLPVFEKNFYMEHPAVTG